MQNEAAQQASAQNEVNSYRNYLNNAANTNLRRREGDSMDRYRSGDIDVRRLDTTGMNDYRRGMITNDNTRIGSQERLGMEASRVSQANADRYSRAQEFGADRYSRAQEHGSDNMYNLGLDTNKTSVTNTDRTSRANELNYNNQYNLGLDTNRASVTNVNRQAQANELNSNNMYNLGMDTNRTSKANVGRQYDSADYASGNQLALGTLQSNNQYTLGMDANRSGREIAALPYDRMTAIQKAQFDAYGPAGLRPQNENLALLNASAANERETAYQNALIEQGRRNLEDYNKIDFFTDSEQKKNMTKNIKAGMSPEAAARRVAIDELSPLYGRSLEVPAQQQAPQGLPSGTNRVNLPSGTNQIQTFGAPGSLNYDNFKEFQQRRNQSR